MKIENKESDDNLSFYKIYITAAFGVAVLFACVLSTIVYLS